MSLLDNGQVIYTGLKRTVMVDSQITRAQSVLAENPAFKDITAALEASLKKSMEDHIKKSVALIEGRFAALDLENHSLKAKIQDMDIKLKDTQLHLAATKQENHNLKTTMGVKFTESKRKVAAVEREVGGLQKMVDPKRLRTNEKKLEEQQDTIKKIVTLLSALAVDDDPQARLRAFLASMENKGGSLFRDGLEIPEDNGEVDMGDWDDELTITM
ncbi:hypothetical protein BR93DRAFT_981078 [Coniochaeta sp. PMI_546]|nr:hypothetical protein BR93DRAFT_981078 [Coniochaeta sp. PMI_546]